MRSRNRPTTFFAQLTLAFALLHPASAAENASLSGTVRNVATGKPLEGALVELPALGLNTLTDSTGRYVFDGLPTGAHGVVATYLGLDLSRAEIVMTAGKRAVRDFDLTSAIYRLDEFRVTGEREGDAAAITLQRNAPNLKNVVAVDSFGNLPNMSAGELAIRLPGVTDYIVSGIVGRTIGTGPDNGYGGQYAGFTTLSSDNAGTAIMQGWEISYQQQYTFLLGLLKGLSSQINYSFLDTHGDFGGKTNLSSGQVAGFVPRTGNASLAWRYQGFGARVLVNYTGDYLQTYSSTATWRNLYRFKRTLVNLGLSYQIRPAVSLTCDIANLFNEPQALYLGSKDRMQSTIINGITITGGLSGRFCATGIAVVANSSTAETRNHLPCE